MGLLWKRRFWAWPRELRRRGILGINARNLHYISRLNPRPLYPRVDDKVLTKQICEASGIPVPQTYAVMDRYGDLRGFAERVGNRQQFVIKPACGAGGRGVLVVLRQDGREFETSGGAVLSPAAVRYHLSTILSGLYSLGGQPDRAIIEQRIGRHPVFQALAIGGTPDVRVIVHRGRPAMAMLRLPTRASRGRANLHQGAVGVGVDMASGRTLAAVCRDRAVVAHPDTGAAIVGIEVPQWSDVLVVARKLSRALELGYVGVDVVLDAEIGPVVLEANARPGLAIQIANGCGLLRRLEAEAAAETQGAAAPPAAAAEAARKGQDAA
jgi:alpha-L-glutamate ligase-like protein